MICNTRALRCLAAFGFFLFLGGCANSKRSEIHDGNEIHGVKGPSSGQLEKWLKKNELTLASAEERAIGEKCEARFRKQVATASDGRLQVAFRAGGMVGDNTSDGGLSTTSSYLLRDAEGRELARAPSRSIAQDDQDVWFSPQGDTVVVYEDGGENPGPLIIVFRHGLESDGGWKVRFFRLPSCDIVWLHEGARPVCHGLIDDMILVDPVIGDGRVYKKSIEKLEATYPFPFTQG